MVFWEAGILASFFRHCWDSINTGYPNLLQNLLSNENILHINIWNWLVLSSKNSIVSHCSVMVNTLHPTTFYQSGVSLSALRAYLLLLHYIQTLVTAQLIYFTALLTHTHTHKLSSNTNGWKISRQTKSLEIKLHFAPPVQRLMMLFFHSSLTV